MPSKAILTKIEPGKIYHIYNRGINHEKLFYQKEDYHLFLDRFRRYLQPKVILYAYCLIPNHYHFLLKIDEAVDHREFCYSMASMLTSYTNKINLKYGRKGSLYQGRYRRREVQGINYFRRLIIYIHLNPLKHDVCSWAELYMFSSYKDYVSKNSNLISSFSVIEAFDSLENFIHVHEIAALQYKDGK